MKDKNRGYGKILSMTLVLMLMLMVLPLRATSFAAQAESMDQDSIAAMETAKIRLSQSPLEKTEGTEDASVSKPVASASDENAAQTSAVGAGIAPPGPIESIFPDPALAQVVASTLGVSSVAATVTQDDLNTIRSFYPAEKGIRQIEGMQYLTNMQTVYLTGNQISDISPLAGLSKLSYIYIYHNQINDISPLAELNNLRGLSIHNNQISDVNPLAGLNNLQELYLQNNQIDDISPLAGLNRLIHLDLSNNQISDINPLAGLKLHTLYLRNNQISDVSPLAVYTESTLFRNLHLDNNEICDISPIVHLINSVYITATQQTIIMDPVLKTDPLITENTLSGYLGGILEPIDISHAGVYTEPNITWTGLDSGVEEVSYGFSQQVTGHPYATFSGTVVQPLSNDIPQADGYTILITTRYADGALPDSTETFTVADGDPFQHTLDILDGYEFAGISLLSNLHTFDPITNTLSIDSVERDFDFVLEFDKALHKVAVTVHYLDDAAPDRTQTSWVEHWSPFSQQLDILEGYELASVSVRANTHTYDPATHTLSIDSVEQDFEFYLEYDRIEYTVKVTVQYPDGSEQERNYPVLYGDSLDVVFAVKDGYRAVSYRTGETGFSINLRSNSLKVNRVAKNMEFTILCS